MPFYLESDNVYIESSDRIELAGVLSLGGTLDSRSFVKSERIELEGALGLAGSIVSASDTELHGVLGLAGTIDSEPFTKTARVALSGHLGLAGTLDTRVVLPIVIPDPITDPITGDWIQSCDARLWVNGVQIPIRSAKWTKSKDNLGSIVNIVLAGVEPSIIPIDAIYKFEIGTNSGLGWQWKTLINNGKLDSRNYTRAWGSKTPSDGLSFSAFSPIEDKFALCPRRNIYCYDSTRTTTDLSKIRTVYDTTGLPIINEARGFSVLSLYNLIHIAMIEGCGFSSWETDIPNYPILRCAFTLDQSFKDTIGPFLGRFRPHFIPLTGNKIRILNGTKILPEDFAPTDLTIDDYESLSLQSGATLADGLRILFQSLQMYGAPSERLESDHNEYGDGDNFTEVDVNETWKDWKDSDGNLLDSKLTRSVKTTTNADAETSEEITEEHEYDGQGLEKSLHMKRRALLPTLPDGTKELQSIVDISKTNFYATDPRNPSRVYLKKSVTQKSGLFAIDSENQQLGEDYKRAFESVNDSGNLNDGMTTDNGDLETLIEDFEPLPNGMVRVRTSGLNHLNSAPLQPASEVRAGDVSLESNFSDPREVIRWKTGVSAIKGRPPADFQIGEIPLNPIGFTIAQYELDTQDAQRWAGSTPVLGFNKDLDRGQFFTGRDRAGAAIGIFIVEGFEVNMENLSTKNPKFTTVLEIDQLG